MSQRPRLEWALICSMEGPTIWNGLIAFIFSARQTGMTKIAQLALIKVKDRSCRG